MPRADFGQKTVFDRSGSQVFKLTTKGQKVTLRFLSGAYYEGKHFLEKDDGGLDIFYCPRIMHEKPCVYCQKSFEAKSQLKALGQKADKGQEKELKDLIRRYSVNIAFYYPILDRDDKVGRILKTALIIRNKLEEEIEAGIDVTNSDYVLTRTEKSPAEYYSLVRLDSSQVKKLSKEEEEEIEKALAWDLEEILDQSKKSSLEVDGEYDESDMVKAAEEIFGKEAE